MPKQVVPDFSKLFQPGAPMSAAIVTQCRALAQMLDAYYGFYDRETSDLMRALAAYVERETRELAPAS